MSQFQGFTITSDGLKLVQDTLQNNTTLTLNVARLTDDPDLLTMSVDSIRALSTLPVKTTNLDFETRMSRTTDNQIEVDAMITNQNVKQNYTFTGLGIVFQQAGKEDVLFAVAPATVATKVDAFVGDNSYTLDLTIKIPINNVQPTITFAENGYMTVADEKQILNLAYGHADAGLATKQDKLGYTPADDTKVVHTTDTILNTLNDLSLEIDTSGLEINEYPRFMAWVYYNGAGIAQATSYAGVPLMNELMMSADLKVNGQTMIPKFWTMQLKAAAPDFDTTDFTINRATDGSWMYLISNKPETDQATIGIHCLNAKFKEVA
ncbi:hypothetical protein [Lactiplantibacillus mudanjiangensis]|uniref:Uncharacterized protein n=1 Tax=Lactiplantibacillus mudanjiangensis TaxID=1296538 RepID=A0A660E195_9LACO|nr:hypothetical protein [Lactiplantibacillus mudanjiangensis]VDG23655.1 hypothetical protein [Lactobacillus plantarum] [Lactiplantibacillus mudanjiangensis]VDG27798.1 hypothetical protein [Lactobacillus plantarum] [Lactiplantibacillus mudanjiangensis]